MARSNDNEGTLTFRPVESADFDADYFNDKDPAAGWTYEETAEWAERAQADPNLIWELAQKHERALDGHMVELCGGQGVDRLERFNVARDLTGDLAGKLKEQLAGGDWEMVQYRLNEAAYSFDLEAETAEQLTGLRETAVNAQGYVSAEAARMDYQLALVKSEFGVDQEFVAHRVQQDALGQLERSIEHAHLRYTDPDNRPLTQLTSTVLNAAAHFKRDGTSYQERREYLEQISNLSADPQALQKVEAATQVLDGLNYQGDLLTVGELGNDQRSDFAQAAGHYLKESTVGNQADYRNRALALEAQLAGRLDEFLQANTQRDANTPFEGRNGGSTRMEREAAWQRGIANARAEQDPSAAWQAGYSGDDLPDYEDDDRLQE